MPPLSYSRKTNSEAVVITSVLNNKVKMIEYSAKCSFFLFLPFYNSYWLGRTEADVVNGEDTSHMFNTGHKKSYAYYSSKSVLAVYHCD